MKTICCLDAGDVCRFFHMLLCEHGWTRLYSTTKADFLMLLQQSVFTLFSSRCSAYHDWIKGNHVELIQELIESSNSMIKANKPRPVVNVSKWIDQFIPNHFVIFSLNGIHKMDINLMEIIKWHCVDRLASHEMMKIKLYFTRYHVCDEKFPPDWKFFSV